MPIAAPLLLAALVASAPATDGETAPIELLALDIEGVDADALADALDTRLPGRRRVPAGDPRDRDGVDSWGYVLLRPDAQGWSLALILADGRGYYRTIPRREGGTDARLVATTLANLIASVEEDTVPADAVDVTPPDVETAPESAPLPEPAPEPAPPHEPDTEPTPEPDEAERGVG